MPLDRDELTRTLIKSVLYGGLTPDTAEAKNLLDMGADVNGFSGPENVENQENYPRSSSLFRRSPLLLAVINEHDDLVGLFLERGASRIIPGTNHRSAWTESKAFRALAGCSSAVLINLLKAGLDPNMQEPGQDTILHHVITHCVRPDKAKQLVQLLLEHQADWTLLNKDGQTPEDLANMYIEEDDTVWPPRWQGPKGNAQVVLPMLRALRERRLLCGGTAEDVIAGSENFQTQWAGKRSRLV
jgi:ankyrin repeat protein